MQLLHDYVCFVSALLRIVVAFSTGSLSESARICRTLFLRQSTYSVFKKHPKLQKCSLEIQNLDSF